MSEQSKQPSKRSGETDLTGLQLGDFRLLRRLGRGAMADVYLADQIRLKRRVAVKILKRELADDPAYLHRFELEAQAAASLVHANIVQIYEVGHIDDWRYIAQEYVQGQNLRDWLQRNSPVDLIRALSIMSQVAAALHKAGEVGVVHRDIKPENIMITPSGEVKVADFGLARLTHESNDNNLTQIGVTLGTPLYMSPEQVEGKSLDPRSDQYSFGVTCYHMLSGEPPFNGETALAVAVQHVKTQPAPLESRRPDLPPALCRIVHTMLAKEPQRRYASMRDALRDIRRVQRECVGQSWPDDLPGAEATLDETSSLERESITKQLDLLMKKQAAGRAARNRWIFAAVGLVAFFVAGVAVAWGIQDQKFLLASPAKPRRQENVWRQLLFAGEVGTKDAWQSVIDYYPENKYYVNLAKAKIAQIYLLDGQYRQALSLFDELAGLGAEQVEFRAFGLAGRSITLCFQQKHEESAAVVNELWPIRDKLAENQAMYRLLQQTISANREKLGAAKKSNEDWEAYLKERTSARESQ